MIGSVLALCCCVFIDSAIHPVLQGVVVLGNTTKHTLGRTTGVLLQQQTRFVIAVVVTPVFCYSGIS